MKAWIKRGNGKGHMAFEDVGEPRTPRTDLAPIAAAGVVLAHENIPPDVQDLLIRGDPGRDVRPGALARAIDAALKARVNEPS